MDNETTTASLNSILLLRHLESYGLEPGCFAKISYMLKNAQPLHKLVNYEKSNISPDSLRKLFDELLYEEATLALASGIDGAERRESESPSIPKKRKVSSSNSLAQYGNFESSHYLPKLISRYYAKYRKEVVDKIREDENQFVELQREIDFIERGCWDSKLQHQDKLKEFDVDVDHAFPKLEGTNAQNLPVDNSRHPISKRKVKLLEHLEEPQDASYMHEETNEVGSAKAHDRGRIIYAPDDSNDVVHVMQDESTNERGKVGLHMKIPKSSQQASTILADKPKEARGNETVPGLCKSSHAPADSILHSIGSKIQYISSGENPPDINNRTSQTNPDVLLQVKRNNTLNIPLSDKSVIQGTSPASNAKINLAIGLAQSPLGNASKSREQTQSEHPEDVCSTDQQKLNRVPHESRTFPVLSDMWQEASKATSSPREAPNNQKCYDAQAKDTSSKVADQLLQSPLTPSRADAMAKLPTAQLSKISPVSSSVESSNSIERSTRQPNEPSSVTKWRNIEQHSPASTKPLPRPGSVSPISDHEKTPMSLEPEEKRKGRKAHSLSRRLLKGQENHGDELDTHQTRSGLRRGARLRASSAATSVIPQTPKAEKRTPSVASHNDTTSLEDCFPGGKEIKAEPSTPLATESSSSQRRFTPELPRTRSRRNAPQPLKSASTSTGRKRRSIREASVPDSTASSVSMPNRGYVTASKSFQRTSAPLMNEIMTHKHASLFSAPVKEKNAEGYRDVIFQPQDLKSIRLAISAGARTVAAAAAAATVNATGNAENISLSGSPMAFSGAGGGSGTLLLPLSPDLVPPRGIVNSAQLEQELMRMFANAVMFNPGDDGVVKDTREMFEAVAAAVDSWKQAEKAAENRGRQIDDDEEVIGTPDEEGRGKRKR